MHMGKLRNLAEWNSLLRNAGLPLELHGGTKDNPGAGKESTDLGRVKFRAIDNNYDSPSTARPVEALLFHEPRALRHDLWRLNEDSLVLAPSIAPKVADQLRNLGVNFIDARGNCFVSRPGMLIDSRGRTGQPGGAAAEVESMSSPRKAKPRATSLFTPRRAQVSALLLSYPALLNAPLREIALQSGVSVGTAKGTFDLLVNAGLLSETSGGYRVDDAEVFLDSWAQAYPSGLAIHHQAFRGNGDLERLAGREGLGWVSGEQAVSDLVRGGDTVDLYARDDQAVRDIVQQGRIRADTRGPTVIRTAFWQASGLARLESAQPTRSHTANGPLTSWRQAPLALIYADLIMHGDSRLRAVAQRIKHDVTERFDA